MSMGYLLIYIIFFFLILFIRGLTFPCFQALFFGVRGHSQLNHILNVTMIGNKFYISKLGFQEEVGGINIIYKDSQLRYGFWGEDKHSTVISEVLSKLRRFHDC